MMKMCVCDVIFYRESDVTEGFESEDLPALFPSSGRSGPTEDPTSPAMCSTR